MCSGVITFSISIKVYMLAAGHVVDVKDVGISLNICMYIISYIIKNNILFFIIIPSCVFCQWQLFTNK